MIGKQVLHFKILERIGAGGMGEVFLAHDTQLDRKVALKFLPPQSGQDAEFKARFEHEAKAAAALNHPNIITVHQIGEHEGRLFIALELVEGQTLEALIGAGDIPVEQALEIALQVCEGLRAAHDAGIVHRDIKPANVLVDKSGRVRILDFGLAKSRRATTDTQVGTTVGTIQYESPEQGRGSAVDQRSDLFSVGVVLYEMIAGRRPFGGEFTDAIRYAIAHDTPDPLARFKSDVPDELQRIVSKLLEKDPETRYQTASGVISDLKLLRRTSGPSSVHSAYHSAAGPAARPAKRGLGRLVIPTAGVVAVMALLLIFKPWKVAIQTTQEATAADDRLAVMYFDNLTDPADEKRQGEVVASLLISDLSESQYMQVVSTQRLYDILKNMGREGTRKITADVATDVAERAKARWMLTGRILSSEPSWVIAAELSDVATGDLIASPSVTGEPGEQIFAVVDRLTREIKGQLALPAEALAELDKPVIELTTESSEAYRLYLEAKELENRFMLVEAEDKYREAVELDSTFAMAYIGIQICRVAAWNDFVGAREAANRAYAFIAHTTERDSLFTQAVYDGSNGRPEAALEVYRELIRRYPEDKEALDRLGTNLQYNNAVRDLPKAIELYLRVIEIDPLWEGAYNSLAYAYEELGDLEQSLWAINKYIELAPDQPNPYDSRAELQARNGQFEEALASYLKAVEIKPDFAWSLQGAIGLYMHFGQYDRAEPLIRRMLEHENLDIQSQGRAMELVMMVRRGRIQDALKALGRRIQVESANPETVNRAAGAHVARAFLMVELSESVDKALAELDAAARLRAQLMSREMTERSLRDDRVWIYAMAGHRDEADSTMQEFWTTVGQPGGGDSAYAWRLQAFLSFQAGSYDSAIAQYERGVGRRMSFVSHVELGRAYAGARRFRDAVRYLEQAGEIFDGSRRGNSMTSVRYYYWLAQVYEKSGRTQDAIENYRRFLDIWKDADPGIEEVEDARQRLAELQV